MSPPCRRPRPAATVTAIEISVIIGKAAYMGLRVTTVPEKKAAAMTPIMASDMPTGITTASRLDDLGGGKAGGASTAMSVVATAGGIRRTTGTKPSVIPAPPSA